MYMAWWTEQSCSLIQYFFQKNFEFVIDLLLDNGFSLNTIFNKINIRFKKLFNSKLKFYINTQDQNFIDNKQNQG